MSAAVGHSQLGSMSVVISNLSHLIGICTYSRVLGATGAKVAAHTPDTLAPFH